MRTILLVDKNTTHRKALSTFLKQCGLTIYEVDSGLNAQKIINNSKVDLTIIDIVVPKLAGLALCQWIKQKSKQQNMHIILSCKEKNGIDEDWSVKQGGYCYQTKSLISKSLIRRIERLLNTKLIPKKNLQPNSINSRLSISKIYDQLEAIRIANSPATEPCPHNHKKDSLRLTGKSPPS